MKKMLTILTLFLGVFSFASAQEKEKESDTFGLHGRINDGFTDAAIENATVYLMNQDSVILDTMLTKQYGLYFQVKRDKSLRSCIIKITHSDYPTYCSTHSLKYVGKNSSFHLPNIYLKRKGSFTDQSLDDVEVVATKVKMFYRGDTIVYNADAFNVANGSMLSALIRQLPGTELHKNGEIFVDGRKVDNLLLNGKDFFRGNNKLMLENLPYYTVKEIKVYEQTPEKAMALHDTKAKKDFVMDVNLKKEYSTGYMANVELGGGTEDAYLARLFGLRFSNGSRFAIVGGANNLNMGNYSFIGNVFGDLPRDERTDTKLLTAELLTEHQNRKNVLTAELTRRRSEYGEDEFQETFHSDASTFSTSRNAQTSKNIGVSLSNQFTLKAPFWMESNTNLRFNSRKSERDNLYYESGTDTRQQGLAVLDSLFGMGMALNDPSMISARKQWIKSNAKEYGASQDLNFAKNLPTTDVLDFKAGVDYAKSNNETDRFNRYLTWKTDLSQNDITEDIDRPNTHIGAKADVSYKMSRLLFATDLKFFANYRFSHDKDRETIIDAMSAMVDRENSYRKSMTEHKYTLGFNSRYFHFRGDVLTICDVTLPVSFIDRNTDYNRYTVDSCLTQSPVFFEPRISFEHKKMGGSNGALYYDIWYVKASTSLQYSLPDATQLITLPLTSDRMNIYQGNAYLKTPATWTTNVRWKMPYKGGNYVQQSVAYTNYINRIVNTYRYKEGIYTNKPDNVNGTWNLSVSTEGRQSFKIAKKEISFSYGLENAYQRMKNFAADGVTGEPLQIDNNELKNSARISLRSYYKKVDGGIRLSTTWRKPLNERADMGYRDTWDYNGNVWIEVSLPAGIYLESDWNFTKRQGYSNDELNKLVCEWDMGLSKSILKEKVDLKLQAIDLLRQYKSVAYIINERGIRETHAVSLPAYVLFSATYRFNKQPKKRG